MDKQHSDHIENRIRQAAEGITTPVTEEAWQKMELLLDNEEKKKRRRGIFWWWYVLIFILVTGSGLWYYTANQQELSIKEQQSNIRPGKESSQDNKFPIKPSPGENTTVRQSAAGSNGAPPTSGKNVPGTFEPGTKTRLSTQRSPLLPTKHTTPVKNNTGAVSAPNPGASAASKKAKTLTRKKTLTKRAGQDFPGNTQAPTLTNQAAGNNMVAAPSTKAAGPQAPGT